MPFESYIFPMGLLLAALTGCSGFGAGGASGTPPSATSSATAAGGKPAAWKLAWSDEFDVDGLPNPAKWDYDTDRNAQGWFNHELQYYTRDRAENARVENGRLIITARRERLTNASDYGRQRFTSARLLTRGKAHWTYGFVEVRARLACGPGTWPAIWALGSKGVWPDDGEIDIMEHVGKNPGQVFGSIHTGANNWMLNTQKTQTTTVSDACTAFHNYQLTWTADKILIGVDNVAYFEYTRPKDHNYGQWPFDTPQYLLLNLAIGGDLGGAVDESIFPVQMEVEYVRVYQPVPGG